MAVTNRKMAQKSQSPSALAAAGPSAVGTGTVPLPAEAPEADGLGVGAVDSRYFSEADIKRNRKMLSTSSTSPEDAYEDDAEVDDEDDDETEEADQEDALLQIEDEQGVEPVLPVKEIVRTINHMALEVVEQGKLAIGTYVLEAVFNDRIEEVLSRNPYKTESMRKICDDPELRVDRRRMGSWVRAAALSRDLEAHDVDCSAIMTSQLVALLRVKDEGKRRELAQEVANQGLTVRSILMRAEELNWSGTSLNAAKVLRRKINDPLNLISDKDAMALLQDEERLAREISYKDRIEMVSVIDEVAGRIESSKGLLEKVRSNLVHIEIERLQRQNA